MPFWKVKPATISQVETETLIRMAKAEHHAEMLEEYSSRLEEELAVKDNIIATLRSEAAENTAHFAERVAELESENAWMRAQQKRPASGNDADEPKDGCV